MESNPFAQLFMTRIHVQLGVGAINIRQEHQIALIIKKCLSFGTDKHISHWECRIV
jgi:hypothetical protein